MISSVETPGRILSAHTSRLLPVRFVFDLVSRSNEQNAARTVDVDFPACLTFDFSTDRFSTCLLTTCAWRKIATISVVLSPFFLVEICFSLSIGGFLFYPIHSFHTRSSAVSNSVLNFGCLLSAFAARTYFRPTIARTQGGKNTLMHRLYSPSTVDVLLFLNVIFSTVARRTAALFPVFLLFLHTH